MTSLRGKSGRQSNAACPSGETASLEGVPGWRSNCGLATFQLSVHAIWPCSLAWESNCAGAVSWIKERVDRTQTPFAQGVARTIADGNNDGESGRRPGSPRAPSDWREQCCRWSGAVEIFGKIETYTITSGRRIHADEPERTSKAT